MSESSGFRRQKALLRCARKQDDEPSLRRKISAALGQINDIQATCGHSKAHRGPMSHARRDEILIRYGLPPGMQPDYEVDHLVPLCLGGSDDSSNLWPEPRRSIEPKWNAEAKDRLERFMCDMVCSGQLDIGTAQEDIATDWIAAYHKYYESH